jgi:hypothetical protein
MVTDGSVQDAIATDSFVISISRTDVKPNVIGGGFLPPTAQYLDPYSKHPEAAALLAGISWKQNLLHQYLNHTGSNPHPLLIPVDNKGVVKDVLHRTINAQTPTYDLSSIHAVAGKDSVFAKWVRQRIYSMSTWPKN